MLRRLVAQGGGLFGALTVLENIGLPMREHRHLTDPVVDALAVQKLAAVGLDAAAGSQYPSEPSGGMLKRAALARALVLGLRQQSGLTIVMITHDMELLWQVADRVAFLADSKVQAVGAMAELATMDHPAVQLFSTGHARVPLRRSPKHKLRPDPRNPHRNQSELHPGGCMCAVAGCTAGGRGAVAGLNLNVPVKYNGVDVGKVQAIKLDHTTPQTVNLFFAIERGTPVKEGTIATLKTPGLTGIACVELSGGSVTSPLLQTKSGAPYSVIRTKPSLSARLEKVLSNALGKLDETSHNINAILGKANQAAISGTLADMETLARTLASRQGSIDAGLTDAAKTLRNTAQATANLDSLAKRIGHASDALEQMGMAY